MNESRIIELANEHLDRGLDFSRTTRIIRVTEAEIIAFARALVSEAINNTHGERVAKYMDAKYPDLF